MKVETTEVEISPQQVNVRGHSLYVFYPKRLDPIIQAQRILFHDGREEFTAKNLASQCYQCASFVDTRLIKGDDDIFTLDTEKCPYPKGVPAFKAVLDFHSGRIAFADSLRFAVGPVEDEIEVSYNTVWGRFLVSKVFAENNIGYGFVGNTSPNLYRDRENGHLYAATFVDAEPPSTWEKLGSSCTDQWTFTVMDAQDFERTGASVVEYPQSNVKKPEFADIKPGKYEMIHYADQPGFDFYGDPAVFTEYKPLPL